MDSHGNITIFNRVRFLDKLLFTKHLSIFIKSGIPLPEAVKTLRDQAKSAKFKDVLSKVLKEIENGQTFEAALGKFPQVFDPLYLGLVRIGEESGTLEQNLEYLADQLKKEYEFKKKVQGALLYPAIIFITVAVVGTGVSVFVLPKLTELFTSLDVELPITTKILLFFADLMKNYGILVLAAVITIPLLLKVLVSLPKVKPHWHKFLLSIPVMGKFLQNVQLTGFCRNFGIMLKSGLPLNSAIETLKDSTSNLVFKSYVAQIENSLSKGKTLEEELSSPRYKFIPPIVSKMVGVGEQSGTLEDSLLYLGDFFEGEVDNASKNLTNILEPIILLVIGGIVAFVALAIITPIYELTGSIKK